MSASEKSSILSRLLSPFTGADILRIEKSRLEAFLDAVPGEYCGFSPSGSVIYSDGFLSLLNLQNLETIHDIQNTLETGDAAVLEGMFIRLQENKTPFTVNVSSKNKDKTLRLSGSHGQALDEKDSFDILWLEDTTKQQSKITSLKTFQNKNEQEIKRLQGALDSLPSPLWIRDSQTNLIWCNKSYGDILNEMPATILVEQKELPLTSKGKDKDKSNTPKGLAKIALDKGEAQQINAHIISKGNRLLVEISEIPISGSNSTLGMTHDITREENLATKLKRHLSANQTLLEQLHSAIAIYDANQKLEFFNSAFSQLWGLEDQWLNNQPKLNDILEKLRETRRLPEQSDFKKYKKNWLDMFTRLIDPYEDMLYLPDGSALRVLVIPHPLGGLMMIFEDVTSRLELESSYNTLIAVQKETLDNLAESVAVYGSDGRLKLSNPSFVNLWKLNPEDLENEPHITTLVNRMIPLFSKDEDERGLEKQALISHGIERTEQEGRLSRNDGKLLDYATVPLPDGGILVSYSDVTDSAQVENALREKNAALETAEQLKIDFLANVSYQLRTPLNAIMGFAGLLNEQYFGKLNKKQKEYSAGIHEAGEKLVKLIDDILDLSTIEAGYLDLNMSTFDIYETLSDLHEITQEWARKESLSISLECDKNIGYLTADKSRVKQVLLNLIHNAINFTPAKGSITINAQKHKDIIELSVSDTGVGISKADQKRIFEPFERAIAEHRTDMSNTALSRGAGLGLSLVKNITELHGGSVSITSKQNKGTTITLSFPLTPIIDSDL